MFMQKLSFLLCIHLLSATDFYDDLCKVALKAHEDKKRTYFPTECQVKLKPKGVMICLDNPYIKSIHMLINGLILQTQKNIKSKVDEELNKLPEKQLLNKINKRIKNMKKKHFKYKKKLLCLDDEAANLLKTQNDIFKNALIQEKKNLTCKLNEKEEIEYKKRKVALCIIKKHYNVKFCDIAPILKDIISRDDKDWKPDNLYPDNFYIINDISAVKSKNEYKTRLKKFIKEAKYVEFYFYDEFSIENFDVIYTNFSYKYLNRDKDGDSRIIFTFDLKDDIENYLKTFEEVFKNYLKTFERVSGKYIKGYEKDIQIFTYEAVKENEMYTQHIRSIYKNGNYTQIDNYEHPIQCTSELMDKDTTEDLDCDKRLKIVDTLDDAELNISLYKERNDAADKLLQENYIFTEFKYLIEIKIDCNCTSKESREACIQYLLIFNDEKINFTNIKKRKIKVCKGMYNGEYSYLVDENEKFTYENVKFEHIKEYKRAIDLFERIKVEVSRFIYSPRKLLNYKHHNWADWKISDYPLNHIYYDKKEIKTNIACSYNNVFRAIQALRDDLYGLKFLTVKPFLFNSEDYYSEHPTKRRNDTGYKCYSLFKNIITTNENIQQQRYSDSYGFRVVSNTYNCQHEYLIYILPSFIDELNKIENCKIYKILKKKLREITGIPKYKNNAEFKNFINIILNHYAFYEMIDNLIFFIYLDKNEQKNLIKSVLEQIFLDENYKNIFDHESLKYITAIPEQWLDFINYLSNELVKTIKGQLDLFLKGLDSVQLTVMHLHPELYDWKDYIKIEICLKKWHNDYKLRTIPEEKPERENPEEKIEEKPVTILEKISNFFRTWFWRN